MLSFGSAQARNQTFLEGGSKSGMIAHMKWALKLSKAQSACIASMVVLEDLEACPLENFEK